MKNKSILFLLCCLFVLSCSDGEKSHNSKRVLISIKKITSEGRDINPVFKDKDNVLFQRYVLDKPLKDYSKGEWPPKISYQKQIEDIFHVNLKTNNVSKISNEWLDLDIIEKVKLDSGGIEKTIVKDIRETSNSRNFKIVTSRYRDGRMVKQDLLLINNFDNTQRNITSKLSQKLKSTGYFSFYGWSFDDKYLLINQKTGGVNNLYVYDIANDNFIKIDISENSPLSIVGNGSWSPSENKFVFYVSEDKFRSLDAPYGNIYIGEIK